MVSNYVASYDYQRLTAILRALPLETSPGQHEPIDMFHDHGRRHPQIWQDDDRQR